MILSPWMVPDSLSVAQYQRLKEGAQELLDGQAEKARAAGAATLHKHFRVGRRTDEEVMKLAEEIEADMIVVGSQGSVRSVRRLWAPTPRASSATPTVRC